MKTIKYTLLLATINVIGIFSYGQDLDKKYIKAIEYLQSTKDGVRFNVSPVIRKMGIDAFQSQVKLKYNFDSLFSIYRSGLAYRPYFVQTIGDYFKIDSSVNQYISFSKSKGNSLVFELRKGNFKTMNSSIYFGESTGYLLIFDSKNEIIDSFKVCIHYN